MTASMRRPWLVMARTAVCWSAPSGDSSAATAWSSVSTVTSPTPSGVSDLRSVEDAGLDGEHLVVRVANALGCLPDAGHRRDAPGSAVLRCVRAVADTPPPDATRTASARCSTCTRTWSAFAPTAGSTWRATACTMSRRVKVARSTHSSADDLALGGVLGCELGTRGSPAAESRLDHLRRAPSRRRGLRPPSARYKLSSCTPSCCLGRRVPSTARRYTRPRSSALNDRPRACSSSAIFALGRGFDLGGAGAEPCQ